jgi:predicted dehydrogenase
MQKLRWGIISTGKIARTFATDIQYADNAFVSGVASRSLDKAKEFAAEFDIANYFGSYEEMCESDEVDAIYVATPHNLHVENSLLAINNGKHVLCEKPITTTPAELEQLIEAAQKKDVFLMEGMWTYFLPAVLQAKKWVDEGRIGEIIHIKADFGFRAEYNPKGRLYNPDLAGGTLYDMGIYPIAISWYFLQQKPSSIDIKAHFAPTGVDDDVYGTMHFPETTAHIHSTFRAQLNNSAFIIGEQGTIELRNFWEAREAILYKDRQKIEEFITPGKGRGFEYQIMQSSDDIMSGKKESDVVPFDTSRYFQQQIQDIFRQIKP